jgi:iron complex transport system permease protein
MPGAVRTVSTPRAAVLTNRALRLRAVNGMTLWLMCCLVLTALLTAGSLLIGTSSIETSWHWLLVPDQQSAVVLWQIRLPRTLGAWCVGALLGLCGATTQGLFRNPLAEPYLLGTASGAAFGVALSLIALDSTIGELAWAGKLGMTGAACIGAVAATALTIALSRGVLQTTSLLLAGIVVASVLAAATSLILITKPEVFRAMQTFLLGSTALLGWSSVALVAAVLAICLVPALVWSRGLDALTLGEDTARSLGLSLPTLRLALLGTIALGTATTVGQVGVVMFVGLMAPHVVRQTLSVNHRQLLIAAPLCGGALLQAADLICRWIIRPAELPVGAVTACVGGAYLVLLLWRRNRDA